MGIYIHVPFCLSKCHYCDFCSVQRADDEKKELYVKRLCEEIGFFAEKICEAGEAPAADTVYFGGGTPTILETEQLLRIIGAIKITFDLTRNTEFTVEANPATFDADKLTALRAAAVTRSR